MKKSPLSQKTALASRPCFTAFFLFAAMLLAPSAAVLTAQAQNRYDNDNTTVILRDYPQITEDLVSGGIDGEAAIGNKLRLEGNGNLYVSVKGDPTIAGSGFESMEIDGPKWLIGGTVTLTGTGAETFHVKSGTTIIGGPLAAMGWVIATNGDGPKATIDAGATLVIGQDGSGSNIAGNGNLHTDGVVNNGSLIFSRHNPVFADTISGSGSVTQTYTSLTLSGSNSYSGGTFIQSGSVIATNAHALGTGKVDFLTAYCTLAMNLATPADVVFNNELIGSGRFIVNMGSGTNVLTLGAGVGTGFNGAMYLQKGTLDLNSGAGAYALAYSGLLVSASSSIVVGSGTKYIGVLALGDALASAKDAGTLVFNTNISNPAAVTGDSVLAVYHFTMNNYATYGVSGTIRLADTVGSPLTAPVLPASSLFEQDDANIIATLVDAYGEVNVNASNFKLVDANNAVITNAQTRDIMQGTAGTVAKATYDYRLTTGSENDGLYVNYGLTKLEILSGKTLDLRNSGTGGISQNTLSARLTGAGGVEINAAGVMWLNGVGSDYKGATTVNSGKVIIGENNGFGSTVGTHIKSGAAVDMNGRQLNVGQVLLLDEGSSLNLNGGYLRIAMTSTTSVDSRIAPNSLSGGGTFRIEIPTDGTASVIFEGDNPNFEGTMSVANRSSVSQIVLSTADSLGAGTISAGYGGSFVYQNVSGTMRTNSINNSGTVFFQSSTLFMTGILQAHTSIENSDVTLGPSARLTGSGTIRVDGNSTLRVGITGTLVSHVTASNPLVFEGGTLDFVPPTRTYMPRLNINNLSGSGTIRIHANPNTGDSNVIAFKKSTGDFALDIRFTEKATTDDQVMPIYSKTNESLATITLLNGQVESGGYVFNLVQGTGDNILMPDTNMWYLAADHARVSRAAKTIVATAAAVGAEWHYSLDSVTKRMGDLRQEFSSDSKAPRGNLWARAANQSISTKESLCGAAFDEDMWLLHAGADKAFRSSSAVTFVGVYGGAGRADRTFTNLGDGSTDTVSVGLYASRITDGGWFIDLVGKQDINRNKFNATSSDGSHIGGNYKSEVASASLEIGKQIWLGQRKNRGWWLEPGVQAAYASLKGKDYTTDNGMDVSIDTATAQQYRAQLRFGYRDKGAKFLPYAKIAAVYNTSTGGEITADERELQADFDGMRYEAGVGGSYIIDKKNQVYLEYEYAKADSYERKWSFNAGYRHAW
ncbi:autotransporter outer membrane beta-barrel domain-containing protein [Ereboglobus luteus]|uniref:Autotransporter domain-containing protein n=1 Tax=Ereboglobus luteus TaxID=1796921 RepID=A0A2U8E5Z6_9BACT|nr:autotransporter outer membrane beta-barrel domain-containing protein [Ereboglobus luteus]AWI10240.1 hypothetical protein CKA38_14150 [Ereboglobus luteus]